MPQVGIQNDIIPMETGNFLAQLVEEGGPTVFAPLCCAVETKLISLQGWVREGGDLIQLNREGSGVEQLWVTYISLLRVA